MAMAEGGMANLLKRCQFNCSCKRFPGAESRVIAFLHWLRWIGRPPSFRFLGKASAPTLPYYRPSMDICSRPLPASLQASEILLIERKRALAGVASTGFEPQHTGADSLA